MASDKEEETSKINVQYLSSDDIVEISIPKEPEALLITSNEEYQNLTNKKDIENRLSMLGLEWNSFIHELNKLPDIGDLTEISENKFNEIIGTLLLEKQEKNDLDYANQLNNEMNPDNNEEDEKRSEI